MKSDTPSLLRRLEGNQVQSVVLLPGYIQVVLEAGTLTCSSLPAIRMGDQAPLVGGPEWLAALWQLVGHEVKKVTLEGNERLVIDLDNGRLEIDVREGPNTPVEPVVLHLETGEEMVF